MLIRVLAPLALVTICSAALAQIVWPPAPKLLYNPSPSAPIGWYRVEPIRAVLRDDMVAAYAPTDVESLAIERQYIPSHIPLIKTVWAVGGEKICHMPSRLIVQNRPALVVLTHDSQGRKLPFRQGCYTLGDDELFLVSTDVQTSFDSRYFGPVPVSDLLGPVQYLGRFKGRGERIRAGHG